MKHQHNHPVELNPLQQHPAERRQEEEMKQAGHNPTPDLIVSAGDPAEEDEVCDEEAHAQMKMNAVSGSLDGATEPERQDTEK